MLQRNKSRNLKFQRELTFKMAENVQSSCKIKCRNCTQVTAFQISDLDRPNNFFSLTQINEELKRHGHPKFKKINGKSRSISQAKLELKDHLINYHYN